MEIKEINIENFRGHKATTFKPQKNVVLLGEPRSGKSDILEALGRVLGTDSSRERTITEQDYFQSDTSKDINITVTLGSLSESQTQLFAPNLELWDVQNNRLVSSSGSGDFKEGYQWVLRIMFYGRWDPEAEKCEEKVCFASNSVPSEGTFTQVSLRDRKLFNFASIKGSKIAPFNLGDRSNFRRIIDSTDGDDFSSSTNEYLKAVAVAAKSFAMSNQVSTSINIILGPISGVIGIKSPTSSDAFGFQPEGGSTSGLLRSLAAIIDFEDNSGALPSWRHGTSVETILKIAEALALVSTADGIFSIDDLGAELDPAYAVHIASILKNRTGQSWIVSKSPHVTEIFSPNEVVRISRKSDGTLAMYQGSIPNGKAASISARHWHRTLLPALNYRAALIVEGPNDFSSFHALMLKSALENQKPLPAALGICMISCGIGDTGGYANVLKLADVAKNMGLIAVGIVDGDKDQSSDTYLRTNIAKSDAIIRFPNGVAIERSLVSDLPETFLKDHITQIAESADLKFEGGFLELTGKKFNTELEKFIKSHSLHSRFVEALPIGMFPPLLSKSIERAIIAILENSKGLIQL